MGVEDAVKQAGWATQAVTHLDTCNGRRRRDASVFSSARPCHRDPLAHLYWVQNAAVPLDAEACPSCAAGLDYCCSRLTPGRCALSAGCAAALPQGLVGPGLLMQTWFGCANGCCPSACTCTADASDFVLLCALCQVPVNLLNCYICTLTKAVDLVQHAPSAASQWIADQMSACERDLRMCHPMHGLRPDPETGHAPSILPCWPQS